MIISLNVKFIVIEQTGRQYSDQSVGKTDILGQGKCFNRSSVKTHSLSQNICLLTWQEYWSHYEP